MAAMLIRLATSADLPAITAIYNREVESSLATLDTVPRTAEAGARWFEEHDPKRHPVTVAEIDGDVVGWGTLSAWSTRAGYRRTAESSVYVHADARGAGVGGALVADLVSRSTELGYRTLLARVEASGAASLRLHAAHRVQRVGTMHDVGEKFGQVRDVVLLERCLEPPAVHLQRISVPFEYPVLFTRGVFDVENPVLADVLKRGSSQRHRVVVLVDAGVAVAQPELDAQISAWFEGRSCADLVAAPIVVPGGEMIKADMTVVERVHRVLALHHMDRHAFVVAIGGGAMLDAVGFAAATAHRGLRLIRMPSTVLAQNDAGVGVKNGINGFGAKNFIGTFAPPFAVINDLDLLDTLSPRDRVAGMAEAVKVALIRDAEFFETLVALAPRLAAFERDAVALAVRRCAELHLAHIATSGDPFEMGSARPLDYGHWVAHKLETTTRHELRHGEAVAIGMVVDARYAVEIGLLKSEVLDRLCDLLTALGLPLSHPSLDDRVLSGLDDFREHLGGELTITLLRRIGRGVDVHDIDRGVMRRAIAWVRQQCT